MAKHQGSRGSSEALRRARSEILSAEAELVPEVVEFRREVLGGRVLALAEARRWLKARAVEGGYVLLAPKELRTGESAVALGDSPEALKLIAAVRALTSPYHNWEESEALRFVLCGLPPRIPPVGVAVEFRWAPEQDRIILSISRGATVPEVVEGFRRARRLADAEGRGMGKRFGGFRSRQPSPKTLALAVFVAKTPGLTWRERMERWNEEHPEWAYTSPTRFAPDGSAAYRTVMGRGWPQRKARREAPKG